MAEVAVAMAVISAFGSIQEGKAKNDYYKMQAAQTRVASEREAIKYQFQANQILQRVNNANASVIARGFAGGTQGFEGSAGLIQAVNNTRGGKEFMFALGTSDGVRRSGLIQATLYESAGKSAEQAGYFDAAGKLAMAAATYGKIGSAPSTTNLGTQALGDSATASTGFGINPDARIGLR
jgi:hypothetical protein